MKQTKLKTFAVVSACMMGMLSSSAQGVMQRTANYHPDGRGLAV